MPEPRPAPSPAGPSPAALAAHARACAAGQAGYLDPETGLFVMCAAWLRARGHCCGQGCRHCPWPPELQARAGRPPVPAWPGVTPPAAGA